MGRLQLPPIIASLATAMLLTTVARADAQTRPADTVDLNDASSVRAVVEPFMEGERRDYKIPGAAFVLVSNGRVTFSKGFGDGDATKPSPVDAERTLFPVGSLSKVVTAIAVIQLAEAGKIDLDADVNTYLAAGHAPFRIEERYGLPVTAAQLLTHTSGMEDPHIGLGVRDPAHTTPLGQYLAVHVPRRVMPPDNLAGYCSEGFSLLGYLVELRSGVPFEAYVERAIFQPLGMTRSSFRQPPLGAADRALGYDLGGGGYVPVGEFYVHGVPSAAMTTTAADMGRLITALLRDADGSPGPRALSPESVRAMFVVRFRNAPRASGWTYGFHGATDDGERRLEHGGLYRGFTSKLVLLPDRHAGFFAAYNRCEAKVLPELDALLAVRSVSETGRLLPTPAELERFSGPYRPSLYARHSVEALGPLLNPVVIGLDGDHLVMGRGPGAIPLRCVSAGYFVRSDGKPGAALVFRQHADGAIHLVYGGDDFEPIRWHATGAGQLALVVVLALVLAVHCIVRPLPGRWVGWAGRATCLLAVTFLAAVGAYILHMDQMQFLYGIPATLNALLATPWLIAALTCVYGCGVVRAWVRRESTARRRAHASAMLIVLGSFLALVFHWNLVTPFAG